MISYTEDIIAPYFQARRQQLNVGDDQPALATFDHFKGQLT